jgi:GWxTD domain-containing protein
MRLPRLLATLVPLVALALPAAAELEKFKDWDKSPEFTYYATDDDRKAWKEVKTDAEADKFYNLFWGRRHPNYKAEAQNVFKLRFDALVAEADKYFTLGKKRGALTERGKVLILVGVPKAMPSKVESSLATGAGAGANEGDGRFLATAGGGTTIKTQFQYEAAQLPEWTGLKTLVLTFITDQTALTESVDKPSDVKRLWKKAVAAALVNPDMTQPPVYKTREQFEAEQKAAAAAAAEAAKGPALSAPVREALEALLAKEPQGDVTVFPLAFSDKATRLTLQLFVPAEVLATADAAAPAPALKVAVLVKAKDGKDAARREEPAVLQKSKGESFLDMSFPVEPGDYDVAVLLLDAAGAPRVSARRLANVPPLPSELGLSPLLIACNDMPAEGAKQDDPFVFSARKFVVRGENKLQKADGLAYVTRVYNPAVDPATKKLILKRTIQIKPKNGSTIDVPQPPEEPMTVPDMQGGTAALILDLAGAIVDVNVGDYFRPGEYALILKVTDVVAAKTVEARAPFTLVAPPAPAAPAKAAAPTKAPAPAPAPKK